MIIDVSFISQWNDLDKIENFDELFRKTQSLINIGLIPKNTMTYKFLYFFEVPLAIALRLYYLKAKESDGEMQTYCYNKLIQIYNKPQFKSLRIYYTKEFEINDLFVSFSLFKYPFPTPSPATHNSPKTLIGHKELVLSRI